MIGAVRKVVIVADHTKFGRDALIRVAGLDEIHQIVSDKGLSLEFQRVLEAHGVGYILA